MTDGIVTPRGITVPDAALTWRFSRSSGPGGQHVNTSSSRVELVCAVDALEADEETRARLLEVLGPEVRIVAASERSQWRNRQVALERLAVRLDNAARRPRKRRPTRPTAGAIERRLSDKRRQSALKATRRSQPDD